MSDDRGPIDWSKTTFDGSRREQLRQALRMTVRERLEALDELTDLSQRLLTAPRQVAASDVSMSVQEPRPSYRTDVLRKDILLEGCTPTPLANYLKALGVLRLLSERDPQVRGFWRGDCFVLRTKLDRAAIEQFFLQNYEPTPIMAPWNGGSGFYEKDNRVALEAILGGNASRFALFRECLRCAEGVLAGMDRTKSPKDESKAELQRRLRAELPDRVIDWLDSVVLITSNKPQYPPILGTGGNDGRLDFTNNFMQRLSESIDPETGAPTDPSARWLTAALFGKASPGLAKRAIGQFSPGQAGGPNSTSGFGGTSAEADASINPWDYILAMEGTLAFSAAAVRRNGDRAGGALSYPFTVATVGAGSGSLGTRDNDQTDARAELWTPLWSTPSTYREIRSLFAEGRVTLGRRQARDALDFIRAVNRLGGYRGIRSYQRFGRLQRSGDAHLFSPLMRIEVSDKPRPRWLDELDRDSWLDRFRQYAHGDNTPSRFLILRKTLEDGIFALSTHKPSKAEAQSLLVLLGRIHFALSNSPTAREAVRRIPLLSEQWVTASDDGTPAFRIAKALAGLSGTDRESLPLRAQLFPMQRHSNQWMTPDAGEKVRICTARKGRLTETLLKLLEHRLWLAKKLGMQDKPLDSTAGVSLEDISTFLRDDAMDARIAALLPGLSLCDIPRDIEKTPGAGAVPAAFALLKLSLTPDRVLRSLGLLPAENQLPVPEGMLRQLAAGNHGNRAVHTAWRRLRSSGLAPIFTLDSLPTENSIHPLRASAALLIPLRYAATAALARDVLEHANLNS